MKFVVELTAQETLSAIEKGTLLNLIKSVEQTELSRRSTDVSQERKDDAAEHEQAKKPTGAETSPAKPKPPEKNKTGITIEKLQEEAVQLLDGGTGTDRLSALLTKYGVKALPDLKPDCFAAFLADLQKLKEATK